MSEKTGYPVGCSRWVWDGLDLGIDSIKRVNCALPVVCRKRRKSSPSISARCRRSNSRRLAADTEEPVPASEPSSIGHAVSDALLWSPERQLPVEMLNLGMGMDSDLGIDSIKRVEIMAALRVSC